MATEVDIIASLSVVFFGGKRRMDSTINGKCRKRKRLAL
jgi:hypothetical protein